MAKSKSFEKSLEKLEELVDSLEEPALSLDKALKLFEEGLKEVRFLEKQLSDSQAKVKKLIEGPKGPKTSAFS